MSTKFAPLEIPPGVVANATKKMNSSNWSEVNLVRWREGQLMPVGGQQQYNYSFASRCRAIHSWYALNGVHYIAYLCETNLYVDSGGTLYDITPTGGMPGPAYGTGGYGDGVYGTGVYGDPRPISSAVLLDRIPDAYGLDNFGGILLAMTSPDGRLLQWDPSAGPLGASVSLTATAAFTTTTPYITMPVNPGTVTPGMSVYDTTSNQFLGVVQTYIDPAFTLSIAAGAAFTTGTPNITMSAINPTNEILPGMNVYDTTSSQQLGTVLTYIGTALVLTAPALHNSTGAGDTLQFTGKNLRLTSNVLHASSGAADALTFNTVASPVTADLNRGIVPTGRCFVVTPERFVQVFGSYDPTNGGSFRRFAWCDQENFHAWDYSSVTSQAGFLDIESASPIITAISTRTGTLLWTSKTAARSVFLSLPYVYNYQELADNCTPWSPQSMVNTSAMVVWFSEQGAFSFDGTSILPIACKVRPWIDDDIHIINVREQACAVHVEGFNEFWWFFPQDGQPTNTRCVIYNYKEGWWSQGQMARSAGITSSYSAHTIMADGTVAYQHELGNYYAGADLPWAETFDLNLNSGSRLTTVKQMIPDIEGAASTVAYSLFYRNGRVVDINNSVLGGFAEVRSPRRPVNKSNGYVDFRVTGRDIRLRIDLALASGDSLPDGALPTDPNYVVGSGAVNPITVGQHLIDSVPRGDR